MLNHEHAHKIYLYFLAIRLDFLFIFFTFLFKKFKLWVLHEFKNKSLMLNKLKNKNYFEQ